MKWFEPAPKTIEDLKKQYKKLAFENHPDRGGDLEAMKAINAEYDILFKRLKDIHASADGETTYTAKEETTETPEQFREIIEKIVNLDGIQIEICGSWIWLTGNTYPHRELLKMLTFRWSKSKTAWYWHGDEWKKSGNKQFTMDEIRELHGSEKIKTSPALKLKIV